MLDYALNAIMRDRGICISRQNQNVNQNTNGLTQKQVAALVSAGLMAPLAIVILYLLLGFGKFHC